MCCLGLAVSHWLQLCRWAFCLPENSGLVFPVKNLSTICQPLQCSCEHVKLADGTLEATESSQACCGPNLERGVRLTGGGSSLNPRSLVVAVGGTCHVRKGVNGAWTSWEQWRMACFCQHRERKGHRNLLVDTKVLPCV